MSAALPHPSESDFERWACRELDAAGRRRLEQHVAGCPACGSVQEAVRRLRSDALAFDARGIPGEPRSSAWRVGALAAVLVAVAVLPASLVVPPAPRTQSDGLRSVPGEALALLEPRGSLVSRPVVFRWRGAEGLLFGVRLFDAEGQLVWSSPEVRSPTVALPDSVTLVSGRHHWQVLARPAGADASELIASPQASFDLR